MKTRILIVAAAFMALSSCTIQRLDKEDADMTHVSKAITADSVVSIDVASSANVVYSLSDTTKVVVSGPRNLVESYSLTVKDGLLSVDGEGDAGNICIGSTGNVRIMRSGGKFVLIGSKDADQDEVVVKVFAPSLRSVAVRGSAMFSADSLRSDADVKLSVAGSGTINVRNGAACRRLLAQVSGSGDIKLSRVVCKDFEAKLSGSGDMLCHTLTAQSLTGNVAGSGYLSLDGVTASKASLFVAGSGDLKAGFANGGNVSASVVGSGDIALSGNVADLQQSVAGSGDIHTDKLHIDK